MAVYENSGLLNYVDDKGDRHILYPTTKSECVEGLEEQLDSKADSEHGTHVTFGTTAPKVAGTAAVGSATTVSRSDHVHPAQTTVSGNAGSATKLATARTLDGVSFNGTAAITHYGSCSTAAATAAKVVACTGFTLVTGARIAVKFTVTNTASSPTLNVNGTGAKAIYYRGSAITAGYLAANRTYEFIYNGTQYELVGDVNTNTTYSNMTAATASAAGKAGLVPAPAAGKQASFLRGDGTWVVPTNTTYSNMTAATASAAGKAGLVPAPAAGAQGKYLRGDGTWQTPTNTTYTLESFGITATAAELNKLDGVTATASELNKLDGLTATTAELNCLDGVTDNIQEQLDGKADSSHGTHVTFTTTVPKAAGTAAVGSATTVSRSDHVHPLQTTVSGNAGSATKLKTARTIDGVSFNGTAAITHYGSCSTAAATAAKVVACTGFTLVTGARIAVKFTVTNTASSPTLNVNGTGAKAIYYRGAAISAGYLAANRTYEFIYNGTQYELVGDINTDTNTTYTLSSFGITATAAELNKLDGVTATATELNYVDGVTSNIQTQLNAKQATVTGAATTITGSNLTASRALVSNSSGKVAVSAVTSTELGYLDGVTDNIQAQLDGKADSSHGTHVTFGTTAPKAAGTAAVGSAATVSRSDHVHPAQTTITGNAGSATKLATSRTIRTNLGSTSAASFNGTANVTPGVTGTLGISNGGTEATTAAEALKNLGGIPFNNNRIDIASETDLNTLLTVGCYRCAQSATAKTLANAPTSDAFTLDILPATGNNNTIVQASYTYLTQRLYTYNGTHYERLIQSNGTSTSFGDWLMFYNTRDKPTPIGIAEGIGGKQLMTTYNVLEDLVSSACTTADFIIALPTFSAVAFTHTNDKTIKLTDMPAKYGTCTFYKGYNNNYIFGLFCATDGTLYRYKYHSTDTGTNGWAEVPLAGMGGAQIATGSYTGTGTYGSSNKNSLTFSFAPKVVMIRRNESSSSSDVAIFIVGGNELILGGSTAGTNSYTFSNKTLSWWVTDAFNASAAGQMNYEGYTYVYTAFG